MGRKISFQVKVVFSATMKCLKNPGSVIKACNSRHFLTAYESLKRKLGHIIRRPTVLFNSLTIYVFPLTVAVKPPARKSRGI